MKTLRQITGILFFSFIFSGLPGINTSASAANTGETTISQMKAGATINMMIENPTFWVDFLNDNPSSDSSAAQNNFTDDMISTPDFWLNQINQSIETENNPSAQMENDPYYWIHFINETESSI